LNFVFFSGDHHSIGVDNEGRVHSWGSSGVGQLGLDDGTQQATTPQEVRGFGGMRIGWILAGGCQSIAITSDEDHVMFKWVGGMEEDKGSIKLGGCHSCGMDHHHPTSILFHHHQR